MTNGIGVEPLGLLLGGGRLFVCSVDRSVQQLTIVLSIFIKRRVVVWMLVERKREIPRGYSLKSCVIRCGIKIYE